MGYRGSRARKERGAQSNPPSYFAPPALSSLPLTGLVASHNNPSGCLRQAKGTRGLVGEIALTAILIH